MRQGRPGLYRVIIHFYSVFQLSAYPYMTKLRQAGAFAAVGIGAFLVYLPALWCGFVEFDDPGYVYRNDVVARGLSFDGIVHAFTRVEMANWSPLTLISHQTDVSIFGLRPAGHHFTSIFLHAINSMVLLSVLLRATRTFWPSVVVAALFAVHPLHVESVAWVSERKDVLSAFFALLAMRLYIEFATGRKRKSAYIASMLCFAAALMSKPMPVTLPFVFLLFDVWPLHRVAAAPQNPLRRWAQLVLEKTPFFMLSAISIAVTLYVQSHGGATNTLPDLALKHRLANAALSYWAYIGDVVWPAWLSPIYAHPRDGVAIIWGGVALVALAVVTLGGVAVWRKRGYLATGWLMFVGMLVPMIGLVQVGYQARADRYMYFPIIGLFVLAVWGASAWSGEKVARRRLLSAIGVVAIIAYGSVTVRQIGFWRDSEALFQRALAVTDNNFFAHEEMGMYRYREGRFEEAEFHFRESLRLGPEAAALHSNLASILRNTGRPQEALVHARRATEMAPAESATHGNLGWVLRDLGLSNESADSFVRALDIDTKNVGAYYGLAVLHVEAGQTNEALPYLEAVRALNPNHEGALQLLDRITEREN